MLKEIVTEEVKFEDGRLAWRTEKSAKGDGQEKGVENPCEFLMS